MNKINNIIENVHNKSSAEHFKNRSEYGYISNKDISVQKIDAIEIENFRTLKNQSPIFR